MVARNQLMLITGAAKGMTFQLDKKIESQVIWLMQICTLHPVRCAKHDDPGTPDSPSQSLTKKKKTLNLQSSVKATQPTSCTHHVIYISSNPSTGEHLLHLTSI